MLFLSATFPSGVYRVLLLFLDLLYRPQVCSSEVSNKPFSTNTELIVQRSGAIKYQLTLVSAEITLSDRTQNIPEINFFPTFTSTSFILFFFSCFNTHNFIYIFLNFFTTLNYLQLCRNLGGKRAETAVGVGTICGG